MNKQECRRRREEGMDGKIRKKILCMMGRWINAYRCGDDELTNE